MSRVALRYADALVAIAKQENQIEAYKNALLLCEKILKENEEFSKYLKSEFVAKTERKKVIEKSFAIFQLPNLVNFYKLLIDQRRLSELSGIVKEYISQANKLLGVDEGFVYSAVDLAPEEITAIETRMSAIRGCKVELKNLIDSRLIGGVKVVIRDQVYDGTILNKLVGMKKHIQSAKAVKL
ncbi:MAG: ATP synthase F1 subunit delta [Bacilli bacterium]|jgi:F-type H+-transporting ATPase subunit delta